MGASFVTKRYSREEIPKKDDVQQLLSNLIDQSRREAGGSYSGDWGMAEGIEFKDADFDSREAAEDWLDEHCQKWGPALVVRTKTHWICGALCAS